jgi:hypothetical protein
LLFSLLCVVEFGLSADFILVGPDSCLSITIRYVEF